VTDKPTIAVSFLRPRRVFFHFRKMDKHMTIHIAGACYKVWDVECRVPIETKRNKRQPYLVMQGMSKCVLLRHTKAGLRGVIE